MSDSASGLKEKTFRETEKRIFREPDGRVAALGWFILSLLTFAFVSFMVGIMFALVGVAALFPKEKKQLAGWIRLVAISVGVASIVLELALTYRPAL